MEPELRDFLEYGLWLECLKFVPVELSQKILASIWDVGLLSHHVSSAHCPSLTSGLSLGWVGSGDSPSTSVWTTMTIPAENTSMILPCGTPGFSFCIFLSEANAKRGLLCFCEPDCRAELQTVQVG